MLFSYGSGEYIEGDKRIHGQILLSEHKLYFRGEKGDLTETFIPLEKIVRIKKNREGLEVFVELNPTVQYAAMIAGQKVYINDLARDIAESRGLVKKFLKSEWEERE